MSKHIHTNFTNEFFRRALARVKETHHLTNEYIAFRLRITVESLYAFWRGEQGLGCASSLLAIVFLMEYVPDIMEYYCKAIQRQEEDMPLVYRSEEHQNLK